MSVFANGLGVSGKAAANKTIAAMPDVCLSPPPPKVMSAVVHLTPKAQPPNVRMATLEALTAAAFGQRRKMLRQSLKGVAHALAALDMV